VLSIKEGDFHGGAVWVFARTYGPDLMPWSPPTQPIPLVALPPSLDSWLIGGVAALISAFSVITVWILIRTRRRRWN